MSFGDTLRKKADNERRAKEIIRDGIKRANERRAKEIIRDGIKRANERRAKKIIQDGIEKAKNKLKEQPAGCTTTKCPLKSITDTPENKQKRIDGEKTPTAPLTGTGSLAPISTIVPCPLMKPPYGKKISNIPSRAATPAFKKDSQGNIVAKPIGELMKTSHGGFIDPNTGKPTTYFKVQKYELELKDGTKINAMKSLGQYDPVTKVIMPDNRMDTDCHGVTFTNGEYWINDDEVDKILDKGGYKPTSQPQVGDILVYREGGNVVHSVTVTKVDTLGTVTEVSGLGGIEPAEHTDTPDTGWIEPSASKEYYSR